MNGALSDCYICGCKPGEAHAMAKPDARDERIAALERRVDWLERGQRTGAYQRWLDERKADL